MNSGSASAFYDGFFGANPNLTNVNGTLFFTANDGINGIELWKSDGTEAGTTLVVDINPNGSSFSNYSDPNLTAIGNNLFFTADNGTSGNELFSLSLDPVANNDAVTIAQDSVTNINVLANDSDPDANFRISSFTEVTNNGRVTLNDNGTLTNFLDDFLVYTPNLNFSGRETFSYTISDTNGGISTATVSIEVGTNLSGSRGADNLIGTPGNDRIEGRRGADNIQGLDGDDTLIGGGGKDTLIGGAGNDSLSGGNGRDEIFGGSGDDTISGDKGNDLLTGSSGRDIFALAAGDGTDTIIDFTLGEDLIGLSGTLTFNNLSFAGNNILFGTETLATLSEVNTTTLTASDFITV
ncbi:MAG: Ig-like domain-containing protein [Prochloraceae cyanobacterium]|nr:Ig-like domain-containing protein [Prochloraceae cyanobacterium]